MLNQSINQSIPAASRGPTILANDRNGGRPRLNASRHDDDDEGALPNPNLAKVINKH